ncbi:hypothetical protein [Ruminococcus sp.]|uniref:hypothetical protein n=1 Tax=Ruminococcus sp. TaxID=41978 RepID=UPI003AB2EC66
MKFVKVLEHNGELYKVGDTICATFNTGISASGVIKEFGEYCFFDEGLKDGIEFGDYTVPLDSIVEMKKVNDISDDKTCILNKDEADTFNTYLEDDIRIAFKNTDWNRIYRKIVGNNSSEFAEKCMENGLEI